MDCVFTSGQDNCSQLGTEVGHLHAGPKKQKKTKINRFVNVYNELSWPRTVAAAAANEARAMGWELCGIWWVRKAVKDG